MYTPAEEIRQKLYEGLRPEFERAVSLFSGYATARDRGKLMTALRDLLKTAYLLGLDRGYDMAAHVYGADDA